jgi:hypothetical protein
MVLQQEARIPVFPTTVSETARYDPTAKAAVFQEQFRFVTSPISEGHATKSPTRPAKGLRARAAS